MMDLNEFLEKELADIKAKSLYRSLNCIGSVQGPAVRFAESVRGILYIIFAVSLLAALVLGQKNIIISLDDIIQHLLLANLGKVILAIIGLALLLYGLKHLRLVK